MKILVLDGNQNQAVASVRSLAHAGHTVVIGEAAPWSKAGWSRFATESLRYPSPRVNPAAFIERLQAFITANPGSLILPMTEATTLPVSAYRSALTNAGARLVLPDHTDLLRAFDKDETTRLAAQLGISVPASQLVVDANHARRMADDLKYPVVLKPRSSEELRAGGTGRTTGRPRYARTQQEFQKAYEDVSGRSTSVLVQEYIEGEGTGYFALMHRGELRAEFAHRRIRDVHPTGSGSAVRISVKPDPAIRTASLAILRALRWHGVAMVEFRVPTEKAPVFLEVNGRFWNSLPLACYAGVEFPVLLAEMAERGDVPSFESYREGVRCRWLLGDFRHLIEVWRGAPPGFPGKFPGRLRTMGAVLRPVPGTVHDLFRWDDPLPEAGDWIELLGRALKKRS
jgi:predicted ATP-grasp superfamily ATP-dependent carboligase